MSENTTSLGEPIETFRPGSANIVAGFIIALLILAGGIALLGLVTREVYLAGGDLPWNAQRGMSWFAAGLMSLLGLGLIAGSIFLFRYCKGLTAHRVELCTGGLRYDHGCMEAIPWQEVTGIRETVLYERAPFLKGPAKLIIPQSKSSSYFIFTKSGKEFGFDVNSLKEIQRFGTILREQADRRQLPWEIVEEHGG